MNSIILAWILSLQMLLSMLFGTANLLPARQTDTSSGDLQESRLFWGMIDPELSLWFSRIPDTRQEDASPLHWDFSLRGFLSALFAQPIIKEDATHAPQV